MLNYIIKYLNNFLHKKWKILEKITLTLDNVKLILKYVPFFLHIFGWKNLWLQKQTLSKWLKVMLVQSFFFIFVKGIKKSKKLRKKGMKYLK